MSGISTNFLFLGLLLICITGLAIIGNLTVLFVYIKRPNLNIDIRPFIMGLALLDVFAPIFSTWMIYVSILHQGSWMFGVIGCFVHSSIQGWAAFCSICTQAFIAFERYSGTWRRAASRRVPNRTVVSTGSAVVYTSAVKLKLFFICLYGTCLISPPFFGWGGFVVEGQGVSCGINVASRHFNDVSYIIFLIIFGYLLPATIIIVFYTMFYCEFRKWRRTRPPNFKDTMKTRLKLPAALIIACAGFLAAWTPYAVISTVNIFISQPLPSWTVTIAAVFGKTSNVYNPIVYTIFDSQFRESFLSVFEGLSPSLNCFMGSSDEMDEPVGGESVALIELNDNGMSPPGAVDPVQKLGGIANGSKERKAIEKTVTAENHVSYGSLNLEYEGDLEGEVESPKML